MADKNSSKNNFIMQAGILAAAGIISRIIGLLYRGPLQSVIGNLGLGYYQSAYNYYTIILLISSIVPINIWIRRYAAPTLTTALAICSRICDTEVCAMLLCA